MTELVVLVGTDFSEDADRAVLHAFEVAKAIGASVELVHVTPELKPLFGGSKQSRAAVAQLQDEEVAESRRALEVFVAEAEVPARAHVYVCVGDTCQALLDHANEIDAAMIVVGRQGGGAAGRFLLGSLTDKLVRCSDRPVLVVPPTKD
ncbi:MAG: universal stress protein [Deltaproteobacteria bacterium]|nr:universal stress protein [Deltaproteobacteria bacterium]